MTSSTWLEDALGTARLEETRVEASRRRINGALGRSADRETGEDRLQTIALVLELRVFDLLDSEDDAGLTAASVDAFQVARTLSRPPEPVAAGEWLVRLGCLANLADRSADFRRMVGEQPWPALPVDSACWGARVWASVLEVWLHLFRKDGWADLDAVQERIAAMRAAQREIEPAYLQAAERDRNTQPAWALMTDYHLAKSAEILGMYLGQGSVEGMFDIREQLEAQLDRAIVAAERGGLVERENLVRLLARTSRKMVENSIWTVTRAVNSRVSRFVASLTGRGAPRPIFEMLPPQRRTLREEGLLGSSHRSVVVSLPTSSGKTTIAEFRMLQALNQFDHERGWVAYLAPTRALVNQLTRRLRRGFSPLDIVVEKVSPALEVDGLESAMLTEQARDRQFRVLVTTPEKLDLMIRGGWEEQIGRPLTLVVVDEAHGLASETRGIKLELLLATINRECRNAQFLLLTPFIDNADEIARWLDPQNNKSVDLGVDWAPNDRVVAIARAHKGKAKGTFRLSLEPRHTSRNTLEIPESLDLGESRFLDMSWSTVSTSLGKRAAVTAQALKARGTVIVLAGTPADTWGIANAFKVEANRRALDNKDTAHIQRFLIDEMGEDYPLVELMAYGIGVHHAGMSEDTRALVEWLTENGHLDVLVATTTIAQGVNFPVSGVVFASHQYRQSKHPHRLDMPAEDFWNIAGRAGRVDQGDLGIIALTAKDDQHQAVLERFIDRSVLALSSTLIDMVAKVLDAGKSLELHRLSHEPGWSAFVQYLAHTYRQIGNHDQFAAQVEQVLRGTLGFQTLRKASRQDADALVGGVIEYAARLQGKPLELVDATGFSWESVNATLVRLNRENLGGDVWSPDLFHHRRDDLRRMMGVLLEVPELRESFKYVTGGKGTDGDKLARIICDWVGGRTLREMADVYFSDDGKKDSVKAMTQCCQRVFGRLTQNASWGLSALQALTLGSDIEAAPPETQRTLRNLPARVYYGVDSDEAVALRLLGVPRAAAPELARHLEIEADEPLHLIRGRLRKADQKTWRDALGDRGESYHRVWSIIEGT